MSQATQTENREALIKRLEEEARQLRIEDIKMIVEAGSGHPGGTLSMAEMIAALYFHKLRLKPDQPEWPDRDRFVLSKGHTIEIDGHDMGQVVDALEKADSVTDRATLILSHTIKGKGVSWMELNPDWHGKAPSKEEGEIAIAELEGRIDAAESKRRFEDLKKKGGS